MALLGQIAVLNAHAAIAGSRPPVSTYVVTNPANFPSLPLPARTQVFLNGLYLTPQIDYTVSGASFKLTAPLGAGDRVSVVDLT